MFYAFGGCDYYPMGGADDIIGIAESMGGALRLIMEARDQGGTIEWWQVADEGMKIIPRERLLQVLDPLPDEGNVPDWWIAHTKPLT